MWLNAKEPSVIFTDLGILSELRGLTLEISHLAANDVISTPMEILEQICAALNVRLRPRYYESSQSELMRELTIRKKENQGKKIYSN